MAHVNWTPLTYLSAYCTPLPAFEQAKVVYYYLLVAGDSPIHTKLNVCSSCPFKAIIFAQSDSYAYHDTSTKIAGDLPARPRPPLLLNSDG